MGLEMQYADSEPLVGIDGHIGAAEIKPKRHEDRWNAPHIDVELSTPDGGKKST